jgi:hypothetical protein
MITAVESSMNFSMKGMMWTKSPVVRVLFFLALLFFGLVDVYSTYACDIIADPFGHQDWIFMSFEEYDADGELIPHTGIYTESLLKFYRLFTLAIIEITVAAFMRRSLGRIAVQIQPTQTKPADNSTGGTEMTKNTARKSAASVSPTANGDPWKQNETTAANTTNASPGTVDLTALNNEESKGGKKANVHHRIAAKLSSLCTYMLISGAVMVAASILILLQGLGYIWESNVRNPFLLNFFYLFPFLLLQVSSVMEVSSVETLLKKH